MTNALINALLNLKYVIKSDTTELNVGLSKNMAVSPGGIVGSFVYSGNLPKSKRYPMIVAPLWWPNKQRNIPTYTIPSDNIIHSDTLAQKEMECIELGNDDINKGSVLSWSDLNDGKIKIRAVVSHDGDQSRTLIKVICNTMSDIYAHSHVLEVAQRDPDPIISKAIMSGNYDIESFQESLSVAVIFMPAHFCVPVFLEEVNAVSTMIICFLKNGTKEFNSCQYVSQITCLHTDKTDGILSVDGRRLYGRRCSYSDARSYALRDMSANVGLIVENRKKQMGMVRNNKIKKTTEMAIRSAEAM